jgi:hypothetical protein
MLILDACLVITMLGLIIYSLVDAGSVPAAYIALQSLFRVTEFIMILFTIRFVSRKKPSTPVSKGAHEETIDKSATMEIVVSKAAYPTNVNE